MKRILAAALAVTLLTGPLLAEARDHDRDRHARHHDHGDRGDHHRDDHRHDRYTSHRHDHDRYRQFHRYEIRPASYRHVRFHAGHYHRPAGYRHYAWHRGARLPAAYCSPRYIVHDYGAYRLHRPPHGHHWVRVDRDVVLAAIATGAVVAVVNNLFY